MNVPGEVFCVSPILIIPYPSGFSQSIIQNVISEDKPTWAGQQKDRVVNITCERCNHVNCISLEGLVLSLPEGVAFLQAHPRIHLLPDRSIEFAGRSALVTRFESVLDSTGFEVISDYETFEVLEIVGGGK